MGKRLFIDDHVSKNTHWNQKSTSQQGAARTGSRVFRGAALEPRRMWGGETWADRRGF